MEAIARRAREIYDDIHAHPELSGQEERTAGELAHHLESLGFRVRGSLGGHGLHGVLARGDGPHIALRTELDALPVGRGATTVSHACGHDLHLACVAGAAQALAESSWSGTLSVIGQPAEEDLSGALAMLADGLYAESAPDVVLAQHCAPFPAGYIAHGHGPMLAASRLVRVTVRGAAGHAASSAAINPLVTSAAIIVRLQTLVAGETGPAEPVVVSVGALHAASPANVVPEQVTFEVWVRAMGPAAVERISAAVERVVRGECAASGHPDVPLLQTMRESPVTSSDAHLVRRLVTAHRGDLGADRVLPWVPSMATEDIGWLGPAGEPQHGRGDIRLAYWMLGSCDPADWAAAGGDAGDRLAAQPPNHSPDFTPDVERALPTGIRAMVVAARSLLDPQA